MTPVHFPEANRRIGGNPEVFDETQVATIDAYVGAISGGNMDGSPIIVVAWKPNESELAEIAAGARSS